MADAAPVEDAPDLVPARILNEHVYCPRLAYLEWVDRKFEDSADTVEGRWVHPARRHGARRCSLARGDVRGDSEIKLRDDFIRAVRSDRQSRSA